MSARRVFRSSRRVCCCLGPAFVRRQAHTPVPKTHSHSYKEEEGGLFQHLEEKTVVLAPHCGARPP